jgi:hypothetical protein
VRDLINILNEAAETGYIALQAEVRAVFKHQFWYMASQHENVTIWQHMDDPSLGEYHIHDRNGEVIAIEFSYPPMPIMDREFDTLDEFAQHIHEITEEEMDEVGRLKGAAKLAGIAHALRQKRDGKA